MEQEKDLTEETSERKMIRFFKNECSVWIFLLFVYLDDSMNNRDFTTLHLEHDNFTDSHWLIVVICEEEQVSSMKCRLHATTEQEGGKKNTMKMDSKENRTAVKVKMTAWTCESCIGLNWARQVSLNLLC